MRIRLSLISLLVLSNFLASSELPTGSSNHIILNRLKKIEHDQINRRLFSAVDECRLSDVRKLLALGGNPNAELQVHTTELKVTPFSYALLKANPKVIDLLKMNGGTLVAVFPNDHDFTQLYDTCALLNFSEKKVCVLYKELFKKKCDTFGRSWLHALALDRRYNNESYRHLWKKLTIYFLSRLTETDCKTLDFFGNPPLYYIKESNNRRLQKIAAQFNFDKSVENLLGDSADRSLRNAQLFVYHKPSVGTDTLEVDHELLENIIQTNQPFQDNFNFFNVEKVLRAVSYDADKAFSILNHVFNDLNKRDCNGNTLLHHIAFIVSHDYVCGGLSELSNKLIKNGLHPNNKNKHGCTPLHVASFKNKGCLVKALLAAGADPLERSIDGKRSRDLTSDPHIRTMLAGAILKQRKHFIARLLENREGQSITRVLGELIADFEAQEINKWTGNVKISYDN